MALEIKGLKRVFKLKKGNNTLKLLSLIHI